MTNTAIKTTDTTAAEHSLQSIFVKAENEYRQVEEMFRMLGWEHLPEEIKFEIRDDVKGYIDELEGCYSTHSLFVQKRRERVDYWVNCLLDGICTVSTALEALKVKKLAG